MQVIKDAVVNLFKSLSGLVAREVQALKAKVTALEAELAAKVKELEDKVNKQ